jgi:hypothetical protein
VALAIVGEHKTKRLALGEICGDRFVSGYVGEQFALPEAIDA